MEFNEKYPTEKLIPYARNSRTHNEEQIAQIVASIKEFGFTNPILIGDDDVIIAGHGRLMAAQRLGMTEVPVIRLPHLTETQRRALVIADNKIALNAGWDEEMLHLEMEELSELYFDLNLLGFNPDELNEIQLFGEEKSSGNTDDDEVPEILLSPPICLFNHEAEVEVIVQAVKSEDRDKLLDELLEKIGELLSSDVNLTGLTDFIYPKPPEIIDEYIEGAPLIKAAVIPVVLQYSTINALK